VILRYAALVLGITACSIVAPRRVSAQERGAIALGEAVEGLGVTTRVLMIAAHPDDEDTRLIAWLARGQHVETAYLSLTRGDGGQNLIGNELGEGLGVIRTEELLAARRIDGAHQYFTRAYDFGFSKTAAETYTHWPHDSVLGDVVQVVRAFRPHVIIAVFTGTPQDGHGQHQVSALLAREAYDVSGDTTRFPVATYGAAWTVSKFYRDRSYFGGGADALTIKVGEYNPLIGESYSEIASRSRSQHRSQGFGQLIRKGPFTASIYREVSRVNSGAEQTMFGGIDTTFARLQPLVHDPRARAMLDSIPAAIARVRAVCDVSAPQKMLDPLSTLDALAGSLLSSLRGPDADPDVTATVATLYQRTSRALALASGTALEVTVPHDVVATGSYARVTKTVYDRGREPITVLNGDGPSITVLPDSSVNRPETPQSDSVTQPWWLVRARVGDLFGVPVSRVAEDQRAENSVGVGVRVGGAGPFALFGVSGSPVQRTADPSRGEIDRPLAFVPLISVTLDQTIEYVPAGTRIARRIPVLLRSASDTERTVAVSLTLPKGLVADSATRRTVVPAYGARTVEFRVTGVLPAGETTLSATATLGGETYANGYVPIEYEHIRPQRLYRGAVVQLVAVNVKVPAELTVGYIAGVGDNVAPTLETLGIPVTMLDPATLGSVNLGKFGAIVVGTRAYQASADLKANNKRLLDYARNGGTLVVQYGQYEMGDPGLMPYPVTLSRPADRVTDENAPVRVLNPASPILNIPNKIGDADWVGWVQERSTYMPRTFDDHYKPVVSINDPGEPPNNAGILVAPLGKGMYVYATLAFFRQLPAGVPGAARLFVNLLAAGHAQVVQ
jgi:LmbE family N-acetylglucosaminyl deacetylase